MIGTHVLVPMRVVPISYSYGIVEKRFDSDRWLVAMPHGKRKLYQAFKETDMLVCGEPK
jgi:hypothetical protein